MRQQHQNNKAQVQEPSVNASVANLPAYA